MRWILSLGLLAGLSLSAAEPLTTSEALISAVKTAKPGSVIELAEGTFELSETLELPSKVTLAGAGMSKTKIVASKDWKPASNTLPDPEMKLEGLDTNAYLLRIHRDSESVTVRDLTLHGPNLHGLLFAWFHTRLQVIKVKFDQCQWSGLRTFGMKEAKILGCEFIDAGGRWERGRPGVKGGITGGGIFAIWMADSEISDNRFTRTNLAAEREFYGIKVRQAKRCRIHHNTIHANFSIEFPFENDEDNEIDHNICYGTISLPKYAGGPVPKSGQTFRVHHNLFKDTYSIEFVRNGIEIDHNLFDFDTKADHGNLISGFGFAPCKGPAVFHNNMISNPGRGVIWINEVFNNLEIRNNHIITRPTATPRRDGLFGFNPKTDFSTITIRDNIIECREQPRPLLRNETSYQARIENNTVTNISDLAKFKNLAAERVIGLEAELKFTCGVGGEMTVEGWKTYPTQK
jgi:Right handed beta helix region